MCASVCVCVCVTQRLICMIYTQICVHVKTARARERGRESERVRTYRTLCSATTTRSSCQCTLSHRPLWRSDCSICSGAAQPAAPSCSSPPVYANEPHYRLPVGMSGTIQRHLLTSVGSQTYGRVGGSEILVLSPISKRGVADVVETRTRCRSSVRVRERERERDPERQRQRDTERALSSPPWALLAPQSGPALQSAV